MAEKYRGGHEKVKKLADDSGRGSAIEVEE